MPTLLTPHLVDDSLAALTGWSGDTVAIHRTIRLSSLDQVINLIGAVDESARALNHPPAVERDGTAVTFTLSTVEVGGVSEVDISLASRINNLAGRLVGAAPTPAPRTAAPGADETERLAAGPGRNHPPEVTIDRAGEPAAGRAGLFKRTKRGPIVGVPSVGNDCLLYTSPSPRDS